MVKSLMGSAFLQLYTDNIWLNRVVVTIGLVIACFLLTLHCIGLYHNFKETKLSKQMADLEQSQTKSTSSNTTITPRKPYRLVNHMLMISLISFTFVYECLILFGLFGIIHVWFGVLPDCGIFPNLLAVFYLSTKCLIYYTFIFRIKIVFNGTAYEYSNNILFCLIAAVTLFWIYGIFGSFTEIYGTNEYVPSEDSYWCQCHLAIFGIILSGGLDSILSVICLILFLKPLITILGQSSGTSKNIQNIAIKYFLLSLLQILSTGIWAILTLFCRMGILAAVDASINLFCVLLMSSVHQRYYYILCRVCHNRIASCKSKSSTDI
eukprot:500762_1